MISAALLGALLSLAPGSCPEVFHERGTLELGKTLRALRGAEGCQLQGILTRPDRVEVRLSHASKICGVDLEPAACAPASWMRLDPAIAARTHDAPDERCPTLWQALVDSLGTIVLHQGHEGSGWKLNEGDPRSPPAPAPSSPSPLDPASSDPAPSHPAPSDPAPGVAPSPEGGLPAWLWGALLACLLLATGLWTLRRS